MMMMRTKQWKLVFDGSFFAWNYDSKIWLFHLWNYALFLSPCVTSHCQFSRFFIDSSKHATSPESLWNEIIKCHYENNQKAIYFTLVRARAISVTVIHFITRLWKQTSIQLFQWLLRTTDFKYFMDGIWSPQHFIIVFEEDCWRWDIEEMKKSENIVWHTLGEKSSI